MFLLKHCYIPPSINVNFKNEAEERNIRISAHPLLQKANQQICILENIFIGSKIITPK